MTEYIDTHTHNSDEAYEGVQDEIIQRALDAGITHLFQPDIDSAEREKMFALCSRYPGILHPMLGLYPGSVQDNWRDEIDLLEAHSREGVIAIGEIGLDYHYALPTRELQKEALRVQLELAAGWDLPVNIHLRDAFGDFLEIVRDLRHLHLRGNLHAFSGSAEFFRQVCATGDWSVGIGGVLTFKKAGIAEDIRDIPMERIVLETDAPYLSPTPLRGTRNESANIPLIAARLAEIKGISVGEVAAITTSNAKQLFAI